LYSLGVPPEIIGTGRGLQQAKTDGTLPLVEQYFLHMKDQLKKAFAYVQVDALALLADRSPYWNDIAEDVRGVGEYLGISPGPTTNEEKEHAAIVWYIVSNIDNLDTLPEQFDLAAKLRKSLG
jgi:phosphoenolpyruvate carboxylase